MFHTCDYGLADFQGMKLFWLVVNKKSLDLHSWFSFVKQPLEDICELEVQALNMEDYELFLVHDNQQLKFHKLKALVHHNGFSSHFLKIVDRSSSLLLFSKDHLLYFATLVLLEILAPQNSQERS